MLGIALALASSVAWGISDFLGGLQSRRMSALTVLLVSQPVGLVLALIVALTFGGDALTPRDAAVALGAVSVVATIGALGVLVPVAGGLARGEQPAAVQAVGAALGIAGVVLVAREPDPEWRTAGRTSVGLAALAALGFGLFFLGLGTASGPKPAWTIFAARCGGVGALLIGATYARPSMRIESHLLPALLAI